MIQGGQRSDGFFLVALQQVTATLVGLEFCVKRFDFRGIGLDFASPQAVEKIPILAIGPLPRDRQ